MATDMIWTDAEVYNGRGTPSEYGADPIDQILGPMNVRDVPCEGCPRMEECAGNGNACVAFRNWCTTGDWLDENRERLLRVLD